MSKEKTWGELLSAVCWEVRTTVGTKLIELGARVFGLRKEATGALLGVLVCEERGRKDLVNGTLLVLLQGVQKDEIEKWKK